MRLQASLEAEKWSRCTVQQSFSTYDHLDMSFVRREDGLAVVAPAAEQQTSNLVGRNMDKDLNSGWPTRRDGADADEGL